MYNVLTLNSISEVGLSKLNPKKYIIGDDIKDPEGIILRSYDMHEMELPDSLAAVARAGAGTIAEFARCGLPSILVPYPYSADNHQLENAKCFEKQGGTVLVRQADIGTLLNEVLSMMKNENLRKTMLKNLERVDSLNDMAKIVEDLSFIANNPH